MPRGSSAEPLPGYRQQQDLLLGSANNPGLQLHAPRCDASGAFLPLHILKQDLSLKIRCQALDFFFPLQEQLQSSELVV